MTTVTTTLVSGQNAYVGAVSSRGEYSVSVNSGVQGPAGNTGANGVSITAANVVSGNLVLTFSNSATIDVGSVVGANGANGAAGANGANGAAANTGNVTFANTTIGTSSVNTSLVIQTRNVDPSSSPAINSTSSWTFGYNGDLTLPGQMLFPDGTTLYNNGMTVSANVFYAIRAYGNTGGADLQWFANSVSMGTTLWNAVRLNSPEAANSGTIVLSAGQFVASKNWEFGASGGLKYPDNTSQTTAFQDVAAHAFYVHPNPGNTYTPTGTINSPYNTIAAAITAAVNAGHSDSDPATIILLASITENVTLSPGIYLTSLGTGTHGSPNLTGSITVTSSSGTTVTNHYSISNLRIVAPTNGKCINFTGTAPQKLFVRDVWLDANGTGSGIYMDNTGTGSTVQLDIGHLAHSGTGDVYCINVTKGSCYITDIETSGAVQVAAVQTGATLTIDGSELDATGDVVCETYGTGSLTITNSIITNTQANGNGIKINAAGSTVLLGNCLFSIPTGTGKVVSYDSGSTLYGSTIAYATITFTPGTNTTVDTRLLPVPLAVAVGTLASPVLSGPVTANGGVGTAGQVLTSNTTGTYWSTVTAVANVAAQYAWTNSHTFSNSVTFSGSAVVPSSNTLGTALGSTTQRWVLIANTGTFSGAVSGITTLAAGNTTITGFANVSTTLQVTGNTSLTGTNTYITGTNTAITSNVTISANLTVSGNITGNTAGFTIGYLDVPQNYTNTSFTIALSDRGKHIYTSNGTSQTITIANNSSVAFPIGTAINIVSQGAGTITVARGTGVSLYLAANSTSADRTIATYGMASLLKVGTDTWFISGAGVT